MKALISLRKQKQANFIVFSFPGRKFGIVQPAYGLSKLRIARIKLPYTFNADSAIGFI